MKLTQNLKCRTCKAPMSIKWLFLSRRSESYTCPLCKTQYEWNKSAARMDFTVLFFGIVTIMYISSQYRQMPLLVRYGMGAAAMILMMICYTIFTPNQFDVRPKD